MKSLVATLALIGSSLAMPNRSVEKPPKLVPCLWFSRGDVEEAVRFYRSVFEDSKTLDEARFAAGGPAPEGALMAATLELAGQQVTVIGDGPERGFTEASSLMIRCESQEEVDRYWKKLCEGGEPGQCGWLKDRFGVSWQVVPTELLTLLRDSDPAKAGRVGAAMMKMKKIDLAKLRAARDGR